MFCGAYNASLLWQGEEVVAVILTAALKLPGIGWKVIFFVVCLSVCSYSFIVPTSL